MPPTKAIQRTQAYGFEVPFRDIPDFPKPGSFGILPRFCATQLDCATQLMQWRKIFLLLG